MSADLVETARRNAATRRAMLERLRPVATAARQEADQLWKAREGATGRVKDLAAVQALGRIPGFFPTPQAVRARMMQLMGDVRGKLCLEPSAGKGNLADELRDAGGIVHLCEINPALRRILESKGYKDIAPDFLELPVSPAFDVCALNAPFENRTDCVHTRRAFEMVKSGGRVVSIMSAGVFSGTQKRDALFREWLCDVKAEVWDLPSGSFALSEVTTMVETKIVRIIKG